MYITFHKKLLYRFSFVAVVLFIISILHIIFIREILTQAVPTYLPTPPPFSIHHVVRHDQAISLSITYTGNKNAFSYLLQELKNSDMPLTIFLPLNYYNATTINELNETLNENDGSLFEWGGWIDYKQKTQVDKLPPEITLIRQRGATPEQLKQIATNGYTTIGAKLTLAEPHHLLTTDISKELLSHIRAGDIIAINIENNIASATELTLQVGQLLKGSGFNLIHVSQLLLEEDKLKIERIE